MYVCLCQGVTDNQIRDAIYEGCCSYREVREATGVGTQCGKVRMPGQAGGTRNPQRPAECPAGTGVRDYGVRRCLKNIFIPLSEEPGLAPGFYAFNSMT